MDGKNKGSSGIWSDTFLRLELWRNVTQRNGEHRGLFITKLLLTQRHRWCVERQRIFASLINRSTSLQSSGLQDLLKRLLPKLSATRTLRLCRSLCLQHLRDIVFYAFTSVFSPLCVTFICSRFTLSLQIPEEPTIYSKYILLSLPSSKMSP